MDPKRGPKVPKRAPKVRPRRLPSPSRPKSVPRDVPWSQNDIVWDLIMHLFPHILGSPSCFSDPLHAYAVHITQLHAAYRRLLYRPD